jgi:hypothetical protein
MAGRIAAAVCTAASASSGLLNLMDEAAIAALVSDLETAMGESWGLIVPEDYRQAV